MPRLTAFCLAANVAQDPNKRLSAHGLFVNVAAARLPFVFPGPIYVVFGLADVPNGKHRFAAGSSSKSISGQASPLDLDVSNGTAFGWLSIANATISSYGSIEIDLTMDGQRVFTGSIQVMPDQAPVPAIK